MGITLSPCHPVTLSPCHLVSESKGERSMPYTRQPSEAAAVVAVIDPQTANNTTKASGYVDMRKFQEALFIVQLGTVDSTIDAKLQQAQDSGGTGLKDITGKSITQL